MVFDHRRDGADINAEIAGLVEAAANGLAELGVPPAQIRTERFGPTGN